jgi:hypothetical protein
MWRDLYRLRFVGNRSVTRGGFGLLHFFRRRAAVAITTTRLSLWT